MTISTTDNQITVAGTGSQTQFSFPFVGVSATDIAVTYINAEGVQNLLSPNQYAVGLNAALPGQLWGIGGIVTYPLSGMPIVTGTSLQIQRLLPLAQQTSLNNQGNQYPAAIEAALDTLCMEIQQVNSRTGQLRGIWISGNIYSYGDIVQDGANGSVTNNLYIYVNPYPTTSGTWSADLANGYWSLALNVQAIVNSLPEIANDTVFGNISGSTAEPTGITVSALIDAAISNTQGSILYRGTSLWLALPPGSSGQVLESQGANANPEWASASGGGTITQVTAGTGLAGGGSSGNVTVSLATEANNTLLANVTGNTAAPSATTLSAYIDAAISNAQGSILYRSATAWVALAPGTSGQVLETLGAGNNPQWATAAITTYNVSANGYIVFPGGLILQWGTTGSVPSNGTLSTNFPTAFPNTCFSVSATATTSVSSGGMAVTATSASSFTIYNLTNTSQPCFWMATGK